MNKQLKFVVIIAVIVVTLAWMGVSGVEQSATYYVTIEELFAMDDAAARRIRVGGDVALGSIVRSARDVQFTITQQDESMPEPKTLEVVYTGDDPLPDTFRDRAQALCDGRLRADGKFEAKKIQAKCASKYEAEPGQEAAPVYESQPPATSD